MNYQEELRERQKFIAWIDDRIAEIRDNESPSAHHLQELELLEVYKIAALDRASYLENLDL